MTNQQPTKNLDNIPTRISSMDTIRVLAAVYVALSLMSVILVAVSGGNTETWVHTIIIAAMSLLLFRFTHNATKDNGKVLLRIRLVVAILIPALLITLIILNIPLWLRIEHVFAIATLVSVGMMVFRRR